MLEELGISPITLWVVISVILASTVLNLLLTLSVVTFILRVADQIKIIKDNSIIPPDYNFAKTSGNAALRQTGLKDVDIGPVDRKIRRTVLTERFDDNGNVIEQEVEPL